jgi:hypothetical protein
MNAPHPSIVFIEVPSAGSPKFGRAVKPDYRRHRVGRDNGPRPPRQDIPRRDLDDIRRVAEEMRQSVRKALQDPQIQALLA